MQPRKIIFWIHLIAGVVAGVIILIMSLTGAAIAFEKEIIATAEAQPRGATQTAKAGESRVPLADLLAKTRELLPEGRPSAITIDADPSAPVLISMGRTNSFYANPVTGELRPQGAKHWRSFLQTMTSWHRWLGREGDGRAVGKAITGACNTAFLVLAVTGLFLWWPRHWTAKAVASVSIPTLKLSGKARDFNWHNAIGLWSAPVLIILTASGMVISYRWASDLVYKVAGSPVPSRDAGPAIEIPRPAAGMKRLSHETILEVVQKESPQWQSAVIRLAAGGGGPRAEGRTNTVSGASTGTPAPSGARNERAEVRPESGQAGEPRNGPQPVVVSVKEKGMWPLFASKQYTLNPFTGEILKRESFSDYDTGRKARTWMRFLHTGEAFGTAGKTVATLASLGGAVLVWTGLALSLRRFLGWRRKSSTGTDVP